METTTPDLKEMYLFLLRQSLLDNIYYPQNCMGHFVNQAHVDEGRYWPARAHTMIGEKRLLNIQRCFENIEKDGIEGNVIEAGVWRGGAAIFMAGLNKIYGGKRKVFAADSFKGLPPPDERYPADKDDKHHTIKYLAVGAQEVANNFRKYNLLDDNVGFVAGFFEYLHEQKDAIGKLAILRLDGDMYSSTIQVLDTLYDSVVTGGYIIVDDYALSGCKKAVTDFREKHDIADEIITIDHTGVYWRKSEPQNQSHD